jgi:ABC-type glycerol-3-phosphate transport system permease component
MTAYEAEAPVVVRDPSEAPAARIGRLVTKLPVHIFLLFVGVLWLIPALGLFLTSLLSPIDYASEGWWKVLAHPHLATWANYSEVWNNTGILPEYWLYALGGLFVVVTLFLPKGIVGFFARRKSTPKPPQATPATIAAQPEPAE